jgi:hypothetical protein
LRLFKNHEEIGMPPLRPCAIALAAIGVLVPAVAHAQQIRPGQWEVTMQSMPKPHTMCITPDMAKDPKALMQQRGVESECKSTKESVVGNTRTFNISCVKPNKYEAKVTFTAHGADHFTMTQEFTTEQKGSAHAGSMAMTYKRVGECK